jgi:putative transposase
VEPLQRVIAIRNPSPGLVHHGDRGSQYSAVDHQALLREHGILISMGGRGKRYDTSTAETFFKTFKSELIWTVASRTRSGGKRRRQTDRRVHLLVSRHSTRGFQSPFAFERMAPGSSPNVHHSRVSPPS